MSAAILVHQYEWNNSVVLTMISKKMKMFEPSFHVKIATYIVHRFPFWAFILYNFFFFNGQSTSNVSKAQQYVSQQVMITKKRR